MYLSSPRRGNFHTILQTFLASPSLSEIVHESYSTNSGRTSISMKRWSRLEKLCDLFALCCKLWNVKIVILMVCNLIVTWTRKFCENWLRIIYSFLSSVTVVIFSEDKKTLHSYLNVILSLTRCRSVEICDPPYYIIGPSFVAGNLATIHINMEEVGMNVTEEG